MIEAAGALMIAMVAFAIGYGTVKEKVKSLEHQIDLLKDDIKVMGDMRVDLAEIKKDIHYIKEKL